MVIFNKYIDKIIHKVINNDKKYKNSIDKFIQLMQNIETF